MSKNKKYGGLVGKMLVAAMAGALAGGGMVGCSKEEAKTDKAPAAEKAPEKTADEGAAAAKPAEGDKKEAAKAAGEGCSGADGCKGMKKEGAKAGGEGCSGADGTKEENKEAE